MTKENDETLLSFPCTFPIKAMGKADEDFDALVVQLVRRHVPDFNDTSIRKRFSPGGQYLSVTVTIEAISKSQLDNIYRELTANDKVLFAL